MASFPTFCCGLLEPCLPQQLVLPTAPSNSVFRQSLDGLADNPLRRTWRGNKQGTIELGTVPTFDNPYEEREWIKEHMAAAFRYWGKMGFAEGAAGHITVRDPVLPDHYWMNPFAEHFSTMTKSMLCLVGPDGYVTKHGAQLPINTAGFYIHSAIHKTRPDVKAAAHCHSISAKAWSAFGRPIEILTQDSCLFYDNHCVYENFGGVVLAQEEGENIAKALGPKFKTCILQNHGLLTLGNTVDEAVYLFAALDRTMQSPSSWLRPPAANWSQKDHHLEGGCRIHCQDYSVVGEHVCQLPT
ncbi:arad-like aldolase/epimerase [Desarmillaria tabescens]|uniref:Arad-like aldolase/epimerase n=1 Tax=Armillaria tabescens TaxID=1929756 RepID=A0AA39KDA1_ARMTA|nr:arad-like aldolase/epimerase [Desarmillaria tabescens]KAK0459010.1 arad-like aldolase/epimerase [Desarmillaria tabescens]